ncbi:transcriptional regulator [Paractinoplanes deccanensis]|uniref:Transcriptional regulator n=1 Tax=Paractinoplanes deccanensis TaxID=113561 RepID=A0ABQ3Y7Z9_9ACTN|nr:transcriptional regulator [Actinoplanes deccanensis]
MVVAEELHFGRAAEALGIAQPPLSQAIQRLERELGVELFDRSRRQIALTTAGRLLLGEARALLAAEERARGLMRMVRDGRLGTLRAGVPPDTPATVLQALLRRLADRLPAVDVDLHELTTGEQVRMLAEARLDVGLVHHPVDDADLLFGPPARVRLGVVLPRASPLATADRLTLADLAGHDLILAPRATAPGWYDHVLDVCRRHGFTPGRVRHARDPEFVLGLVLAGRGVTVEAQHAVRREPRVTWRPIVDHPLHRVVSAAWSAQAPHPAAEHFARIAAETLGEPSRDPMEVPALDAERPWSVVFARQPVIG